MTLETRVRLPSVATRLWAAKPSAAKSARLPTTTQVMPMTHLGRRIMLACMWGGLGRWRVSGSKYRFSRWDSFCRFSP